MEWVPVQSSVDAVRAAYVAVFAVGALGCGVAAFRARRLDHADTRTGLVSLLLSSGLWAGATGVRLLVGTPAASRALFLLELTVGLATVGAWLYFASAYTGETYHRNPTIRRFAAGTFLAVVAVKLTNPLHGLYVTTRFERTPFPHLVIDTMGLHLAVMTFSYALAALGFYMLFQLFLESKAPTRPLAWVVGLAALPVLVNVAGQVGVAGVLQLSYEPLGVAAFALGTLYFAETTFERARWTRHRRVLDQLDEAIVLVDTEDRIRDFNDHAETLFPDLASAVGKRFADVAPSVVAALDTNDSAGETADPVAIDRTLDGARRYYLPSSTTITYGSYTMGRVIICADVTEVERQRRELHRQNDQLDGFAAAVAHELRNTLAIVDGKIAIVAEAIADSTDRQVVDAVATAMDALDRMDDVVADLTTLARYSQTVEDAGYVDFRETLSGVAVPALGGDVTVTLEGHGQIRADPGRLEELVRQAARLTAGTGGTTLTVTLRGDRMTLTTDGEPVPDGSVDDLFTYGTAVPRARVGMLGPNIRALARAHGWDVALDDDYRGGIRIHLTGIQIRPETA